LYQAACRKLFPSVSNPNLPTRKFPCPRIQSWNIRIRLELMDAVRQVLRRHRLRQRDAAALLGVAQPRVSDLVRGKVALFYVSIPWLVDMLDVLGVAVNLEIRTDRAARAVSSLAPSRTSSPQGPQTE
jgi:predicted XRE-type DNA-binding protein